jgi:hypothetical protein
MRLSPVGRIVAGVLVTLLVVSYIMGRINAGGATPFLFLIAAVIVVAVIVFSVTRRLKGPR